MRVARGQPRAVEEIHLDTEGPRHAGLAQELLLARLGQRDGDRTGLAHAGGEARLRLQPRVELGGVFREPRHVGRGAELRDQAGGVPGRAAGELLAFQEDHVAPAELGQVIGDGATDHTPADDDGARGGGRWSGERHARSLSFRAS